jgi:hypothetical protein
MTYKGSLHIFAFGVLEWIMFGLFSIFIWIDVIRCGVTYASLAFLILVAVGIGVSAGFYFFRRKAKAYFFVTVWRWALMVLLLIVSSWDTAISGDFDVTSLYYCFGSLLIAVVIVSVSYKLDCKRWQSTLKVWQEIRKIDFEHKLFCISVPNYLMNRKKKNETNYKKALIGGVLTFLLLRFSLDFFGSEGLEEYILKLAPSLLALIFSWALGIFLSWLINFSKMEREMQVEFVTEYGEQVESVPVSDNHFGRTDESKVTEDRRVREKQDHKPQPRFPIKIKWKVLISGCLGVGLIPMVLLMLCDLLNGDSVTLGELVTAIIAFQMGAFFISGFFMGYMTGAWPWLEMALVFGIVFQASLKMIAGENPKLKSLNLLLFCLVLYGGCLMGGVGLGILLKKINLKQQSLTIQESEITQDE